MVSIFKYLPSAYVERFINNGEVLFRSLSYFRSYEEQQVRGDPYEGVRLYQPQEGLHLTKLENGENIVINGAFESKVREREILILCMSSLKNEDLAKKFTSEACIEIYNKAAFLSLIRASLKRRRAYKSSRLLYGEVQYYQPESHPKSVWALPEKIVMRKTMHYEWQHEYRIAFGAAGSLDVEAVTTQITTTPGVILPVLDGHPEIILRLGSLRHICRVHYFA